MAPYLKTRKVFFIPSKKKKKRKAFLKWKQKKGWFRSKSDQKGYASKRKDDDQESRSRNGEAQPKLSLQWRQVGSNEIDESQEKMKKWTSQRETCICMPAIKRAVGTEDMIDVTCAIKSFLPHNPFGEATQKNFILICRGRAFWRDWFLA